MVTLKSLFKKQKEIISKIKSIDNFMKGSIYLLNRKCSNPKCKCNSGGKKHSSYVLTFSEKGKTKILSLKKDQQKEIKNLTEKYKKMNNLILQLTTVNIEIIKKEKEISKK